MKIMRWNVIAEMVNMRQLERGVELGVQDGKTFCYLLQNCPTLKRLVGVDLWEPKFDQPKPNNYIEWDHSGNEAKVRACAERFAAGEVLKTDTKFASRQFSSDSIDFVFIDADHSVLGCFEDIRAWWPKVRQGGLIIGHDYHWPSVRFVVDAYFNGISPVTAYADNVWSVERGNRLSAWQPSHDQVDYYDSITATLFQDNRLPKHRPQIL